MTSDRTMVFVQAALPFYRRRLLELMDRRADNRLHVFAGGEHFDPSLRTDIRLVKRITLVRNRYLFGRRALWQHGVVAAGVFAPQALLEFNPRILNVWLTVALRRALGKKTALYGHAWGRRGRGRLDFLRHILRRTAGQLIVYTESEATEVREQDSKANVVAAGNAIYALSDAGAAPVRANPRTFIFVGRLVAAKKPGLLLEAFSLARGHIPEATLLFIGEGPERQSLERRAREVDPDGAIAFSGHQDDVEALRDAYANAVASVSPGYAGLSLIQSLWFGVPMLIARNEPHAPEIEAACEGKTAYFCASDSPADMAAGLLRFWSERDAWMRRRENLARTCTDRYSVDRMAARLVDAAS